MSTTNNAQWIKAAQQWIEWDMNDGTKALVQKYLDTNDFVTLRTLFHRRLEFGTAGLRAAMGPGTTAINDLVIVQTAQGLCDYLLRVYGEKQAQERGIVIGYDHRANQTLYSKRFAQLTAAVCLQKGIKVYLYQGFVATPLVPFGIEHYQCAAGVMVTASHNPKADNGYKVYWGNGCQIIPPHDAGIAASILNHLKPWIDYSDSLLDSLQSNPLVHDPTDEVASKYFTFAQQRLCHYPHENALSTSYPIAYSPMHGVGHAFTSRSFQAFQLPPYIPVLSQLEPDPEFPTVAFPNPEEGQGAFALAMATAETHDCRLILANDPDADRLAVAERDPVTREWKIFTGNEIGVVLGHWTLTQHLKTHPTIERSQLFFITSTVSSKMLATIAEKEGMGGCMETLTGFKWIGNAADELRKKDKIVLFSYEEAIGFCVGDVVKDKDGVVAAAVVAELAIHLFHQKQTIGQYLENLYTKYGYFLSQNHYFYCYEPVIINKIFTRLRNEGQYWYTCGPLYPIAHIRDLTTGYDSRQEDYKAILPASTSSQMITFCFKNHCIATLRTSGTEPKLKYYIELKGEIGISRNEIEKILQHQVQEIIKHMLQPMENQLK